MLNIQMLKKTPNLFFVKHPCFRDQRNSIKQVYQSQAQTQTQSGCHSFPTCAEANCKHVREVLHIHTQALTLVNS